MRKNLTSGMQGRIKALIFYYTSIIIKVMPIYSQNASHTASPIAEIISPRFAIFRPVPVSLAFFKPSALKI